jgi:hypothetical protein
MISRVWLNLSRVASCCELRSDKSISLFVEKTRRWQRGNYKDRNWVEGDGWSEVLIHQPLRLKITRSSNFLQILSEFFPFRCRAMVSSGVERDSSS